MGVRGKGWGDVPLVRRGGMNSIIVRIKEEEESSLDFLNFKETDNGIEYQDTSGYMIPIARITVESPEGTFRVKGVSKTELSKMMCNILGETDNYYIVRNDG